MTGNLMFYAKYFPLFTCILFRLQEWEIISLLGDGLPLSFVLLFIFFKKIYSKSDFNLPARKWNAKKQTEAWDLVYLCENFGNTFLIKLELLWNKIALSLSSTEKLSFLLMCELSKYINVESTLKQHWSSMFIDVDIWFKMKVEPAHLYRCWNDVAFLTLT